MASELGGNYVVKRNYAVNRMILGVLNLIIIDYDKF